jgi:putative spermidine/putrescine transport system ATP-binding protein
MADDSNALQASSGDNGSEVNSNFALDITFHSGFSTKGRRVADAPRMFLDGPMAGSTQASDEPGDDVIVRLAGVEKSYDGATKAVRDLNLVVYRGEFLTLLGPSGSGKTTTLMMLAGFEDPSAGDILLGERSLRNVPPHRRNMGVVFQSYALFPHLSVFDNVRYPLARRRVPKHEARERALHALRMVQLEGLAARRPHQLSGGQQQRVALARALVFRPDVVLMDEPLGALDRRLREQMQLELKRLHAQLGMTFLYVTHDQGEALTMSDRIAVFRAGRIEQVGTPQEVYERPATPFVADFLGESNSLAGTVLACSAGRAEVRLENGSTVAAVAGPGVVAGARVMVAVRPERVALVERSDHGVNVLSATVRDAIYFGDHCRLQTALQHGAPFSVKLQPGAGAPPAPNTPVRLGWRPEDCRALVEDD